MQQIFVVVTTVQTAYGLNTIRKFKYLFGWRISLNVLIVWKEYEEKMKEYQSQEGSAAPPPQEEPEPDIDPGMKAFLELERKLKQKQQGIILWRCHSKKNTNRKFVGLKRQFNHLEHAI